MNINRYEDGKTTIIHRDPASLTDFECIIYGKEQGGDSSARFVMKTYNGQAEGRIEMCGEWERNAFFPFLKQIVYEMELLDKIK